MSVNPYLIVLFFRDEPRDRCRAETEPEARELAQQLVDDYGVALERADIRVWDGEKYDLVDSLSQPDMGTSFGL